MNLCVSCKIVIWTKASQNALRVITYDIYNLLLEYIWLVAVGNVIVKLIAQVQLHSEKTFSSILNIIVKQQKNEYKSILGEQKVVCLRDVEYA